MGIAENQPDYHFWEWLAAIVLYHATGYRALVEKYAYANHPRKQEMSRSCFLTMCCGFSATGLSMVPFRAPTS